MRPLLDNAIYENIVMLPFDDKDIIWSIAFIHQDYAGRNASAQYVGKRRGAYGKRKIFQDIPADIDLTADRAAIAHAIVVSFCRNKKTE